MRVMRRSLAASIGLIHGTDADRACGGAGRDHATGTAGGCRAANTNRPFDPAPGPALREPTGQSRPRCQSHLGPDEAALARDGSTAEIPQIVGHGGVDGDNERYVGQIDAAAMASFEHCTPLHGLPAELYDGPGGWSHIMMRYKLPG